MEEEPQDGFQQHMDRYGMCDTTWTNLSGSRVLCVFPNGAVYRFQTEE